LTKKRHNKLLKERRKNLGTLATPIVWRNKEMAKAIAELRKIKKKGG